MRVLLLIIACLTVLIPLAYLVINSLKLPREFLTVPPTILPTEVTFEHYQEAFGNPKTSQFFTNSLIVASVTTVVTIVFGTLAAYGLARMGLSARWLSSVVFMFLFIRFYPRVTTVIPYFLIMRQLKLLDTVWAIIIGHLGITIPFVTWLMLIVFNELPKEVEEAAVVDGASPWQRFWHVVLPMTAPGVASAAILTAFLSWNEFLIAASVARRKAMVLSIAVASFVTDKGILWGQMSAMSVVMIVPMLLFALFVQRYLIRGITLGAVKG
jgi:multiple sugar transport system permease protein